MVLINSLVVIALIHNLGESPAELYGASLLSLIESLVSVAVLFLNDIMH